jgi:hypothetical protein
MPPLAAMLRVPGASAGRDFGDDGDAMFDVRSVHLCFDPRIVAPNDANAAGGHKLEIFQKSHARMAPV